MTLQIEGLSVERSGRDVLAGLSCTVPAGGALALLGDRGAGKSTLVLAMLGLLSGARVGGSVRLDGDELLASTERRLAEVRGARIGVMLQHGALDPELTAGAQLGEALRTHRPVSEAAARDRAIDTLELVGVPEPHRAVDRYAAELSPALRRRVLLALALVAQPALLVLDEPTEGLPATERVKLLERITELRRQRGAALLVLTRDPGTAAQLADEVAVLQHGRIAESGPPGPLFGRPVSAYVRALLDARPRLDRPRTAPLIPITGPSPGPARPRAAGEPLLQIDGPGATLELHRGEAVALLAEPGGGAQELARAVAGLGGPRPVKPAGIRTAWLGPDPDSALNPVRPARTGATAELLAWAGLPPHRAARRPADLTASERVCAALARALAPQPELLVLEEPVARLDADGVARVVGLLRMVPCALLLATEDIALARLLADRIGVFYAGELVELAPPDWLIGAPHHPYTGALLASAQVPNPAFVRRARQQLPGEAPAVRPRGCAFHPRCAKADARCAAEPPALAATGATLVACHHPLTRDEVARLPAGPRG